MTTERDPGFSRRDFVQSAVSGAALAAVPLAVFAAAPGEADKAAVLAQIPKMHAANIKRLQEWIALPSIAAENRNFPQGPEHMAKLAQDAGFTGVSSSRPPANREYSARSMPARPRPWPFISCTT